ncbi:GNAT family N-acetyltransferase [Granulicoccus sp. GXG6511]|uniref:GNAT family N-acetyltransferase n=1 Tax=Granulicoccus sp. GXG6511 TaxID=3381351 RepID=UPI003D7DD777
MTRKNSFGQPIGEPIDWSPRTLPQPVPLVGEWVRLDPLAARHAPDLLTVLAPHPELWTYRTDEPPADLDSALAIIRRSQSAPNIAYAVVPAGTDRAFGILSIIRSDPANGTTEIGAILYAPELQQTPASTEATHLVARHVFDDLGYRRLEWKCDSLNEPSRRAATRLGFTEEGTFRNSVVYKNRSRDTTWFSLTDGDWPRVRSAHRRWLDPANFDAEGHQRATLSESFATLES